MRLSRVEGWIAGLAIGVLFIGMAGCAPPDVEEPVVEEEPEEVAVRPFSEIDDPSTMTIEEIQEMSAVFELMNAEVLFIEIRPGENYEDDPVCNREVDVSQRRVTIDYSGEWGPNEVVWYLDLGGRPELWRTDEGESDTIFLMGKGRPCFAGEGSWYLKNPVQRIESGPPSSACKPGEADIEWWYYVDLLNEACVDGDGLVDKLDPVVVIDPGRRRR